MGLSQTCPLQLQHFYDKGEKNLITDVPGVRVGHVTMHDAKRHIHTGVTAVLPHTHNLFRHKVWAGVSVINGFGKSAGLVQIEELGTLESPIVLTNTLSVGTALEALVQYILADNPEIGVSTGTVNAVVTECNDGSLNDIRGLHVTGDQVRQALEEAAIDFPEGAVGAGSGMTCLGFKGGIGSASRRLPIAGHDYLLGALVLANFGRPGRLQLRLVDGGNAAAVNRAQAAFCAQYETPEAAKPQEERDQGSCIIILATDIPLSSRQLKRVANRAAVGLARTGSYIGHGSGDIALAFSTAQTIDHFSDRTQDQFSFLREDTLDSVFEAAAEAVEEAIVSCLWQAPTLEGIRGKRVPGLADCWSAHK